MLFGVRRNPDVIEYMNATPSDPAMQRSFNARLNNDAFKDPHKISAALKKWIDSSWKHAVERKCHSPAFHVPVQWPWQNKVGSTTWQG